MSEAGLAVGNRARKTLAALRNALLALLQRKQFDEITIKDIIAEAEIGIATFYRHYATKNALLEHVAAAEIQTLVEMAVSPLGTSDSRVSTEAMASYVDEHRALWSTLLSGGAAGEMREGFMRQVTQAYKDGDKLLNTWVPPELGIIFGVTATVEIIAWWLRQPPGISISEIARLLEGLVIQPTLHRPSEPIPSGNYTVTINANIKIEHDGAP